MNTEKAILLFLKSRQAKGLSPNTIRWYRGILTSFKKTFPSLPSSIGDIETFLINCKAGEERRHGYYRSLKCFYRLLAKREGVSNPMEEVVPPYRRKKEPKFLMPQTINKLLAYRHPPKLKTALLFLTDTGARLGELANLKMENIIQTQWGFIASITGKTGTRLIPISYETYRALAINLPFSYSSHWLGVLISRAFKSAGVKGSASNLRHSFGTLWEGDELVLQQIMGHSHLSTTKIYRQLRTKLISQQHHQYSPLKMVLSSSKEMFMI